MRIHIKNNSVLPKRIFAIGRGSYGFDQLDFVFSKEWKKLSIKIIFISPTGERASLSFDGSPIKIPRNILASRGKSLIFAVGTKGDHTLTSMNIELWVTGEMPQNDTENANDD